VSSRTAAPAPLESGPQSFWAAITGMRGWDADPTGRLTLRRRRMTYSADAPQNAFRCELQLRWSDQDLLGHVNNARTVTLAEEARVRADTAWFDDAAKVGSRVVRT